MSTEPFIYKQPQKDTFRGWLILFLIACGCGVAMTIVNGIITFNIEDYNVGGGQLTTTILAFIDILYVAGIAGFGIFMISSFVRRNSSAPLHGIIYCAIVLYSNLIQVFLAMLIGEFEQEAYFGSGLQVGRGIIWSAIWISYLLFSNQIKEFFPRENWKLSNPVLVIVVVIIFLPILEFCLSILFSPMDSF